MESTRARRWRKTLGFSTLGLLGLEGMGEGDGDLEALEEEVREMDARVKRMRSQGPARFKSLLQEHLVTLRPPPTLEPPLHTPYLDGVNGDLSAIQTRRLEALNSLPGLLERINKCTDDLSATLAKLKHKRSYDLVFELPHPTLPEEDGDGSLASRFFPT
ncbi:uncharacterized protein LOC9646931 [Selaginella moellendorffii]|nr:uncharacterized protein LOC9646931 [Selaginella moellendorffii]|eukprot:XP_002961775.2 uncharacterized protein LOC9646931 [Selaginella moellendorffii]